MRRKCPICKKTASTRAMWDFTKQGFVSACKWCLLKIRHANDLKVERELTRRAYLRDETWSLDPEREFEPFEVSKEEWSDARRAVRLAEAPR